MVNPVAGNQGLSTRLETMISESAVWSAIHRINGALETTLVEVFDPGLSQLVAETTARPRPTLGDFGTTTATDTNGDLPE
jgi:hypothetical protein